MTADEFRAMRTRLGCTQLALADRLDMGERQIRNFETGEWPVPRVVELALAQLIARHTNGQRERSDGYQG